MKSAFVTAALVAATMFGCSDLAEPEPDPGEPTSIDLETMEGMPVVVMHPDAALPAPDAAITPEPDAAIEPEPDAAPPEPDAAPVCGNGEVEAGEDCDDGNAVGQDGCSADCHAETLCCCGNGAVEPGEQCDDGNQVDGDGCNWTCQIEP